MSGIVTLTMNPAVDVSTTVAELLPAQKLRCGPAVREPGGGGINVARVVAELGGQARAVYPAGGVMGALLGDLLDELNIPHTEIPIAGTTRESIAVTCEATGRQYRFVFPGPEFSDEETQRCLDTLSKLDPPPGYVIASGSLPPGLPHDFLAETAKVVLQSGARLVVDTSGAPLSRSVDEDIYLIKPNLRELQDLVDARLEGPDDWIDAARRIVSQKPITVVALTLGDEGALLVTQEQVIRAFPASIDVVSSVGAGDSFLGAMIWRLDASNDLVDAFRYGVAAGSAALLTPGTGLCRREDIERLYHEVRLERL
jgi:6-phosphofructokinase 2